MPPLRHVLAPVHNTSPSLRNSHNIANVWSAITRRSLSKSSDSAQASVGVAQASNSRWLSDIKARLGACIGFGCNDGEEIALAGKIARTLGREWRGLVAGAEGFYVEDAPDQRTDHERLQRSGADSTDAQRDLIQFEKHRQGNAWVEGVRWGDMDSMIGADLQKGHVNNASYLRYAEISRVHYFRRLARFIRPISNSYTSQSPSRALSSLRTSWDQICTPQSLGIIYSQAKLSFLLPVKYPDRLTLCHRLADNIDLEKGAQVGMIPLQVVALSNRWQRNAVRVYEENVVFDYRKEKRGVMEQWMVDVLRRAREEEVRMKKEWTKRKEEVERWVGELESRTNKSGQQEDMGS